ncbi:hypothetical protein G6F46_011891 [Rhizopus delemar]|uniref:Uncharacterized protein n=2 Tax=Rhizopus TaxID=4842 RepID=A0A9P6Z2S2_9FUNG|nr:hypothetical protein G6F55_009866 [Rhizopus delemar]KAG1536130.1 hypothetical protein G6F51_011139 [Rhizopus arrhizus]KAG1502572.1 hypothetical protein G6F53_010825 [Rhizopus delemar]KAG1512461.1 hypothetical protein G6F52_010401 [Rhizopus delemar]KAG1542999.1 hypothetical protein G6F49_011468 [Rhizopus delemar]
MYGFHITMSRLDIHVHKSYYLNASNISLYSEEDFKVKFWSHLLEELFSLSNVCLHWGDTVPTIFKKTEARPKVDLRIMSILNSKEGDYSLGEFSKIAESTKLYEDKLKLALMAKFHLNSLIKNNTDCIYPFIMIMGFEFVFLTMEFIEGVGYIINQIDQCCFPITKKAINCGGTQALINCINTVKNFVSSMKDRKEDGKREKTVNKIKQLVGEKKEEKTKQNTTAVFWPKTKDGLFLVEAAAKSEDDVGECVSGGETEDEEDDEDE